MAQVRKSTHLRAMLNSPQTEFLLEAHNGISARIVEEAGFDGIWASGLAISAQHGLRDNNELSWSQVVETLEFMADVTSIPILVDGDTGFGDFNNLRLLVRKLEQRGIAGVCIEDKCFPKRNSFIAGERQPLAEIDEFCGKIKAGKDSQQDPDFCLVARTEALIAGWGLDEALRRAEAYQAAGADAILIHSKQPKPDEVLAFARHWQGDIPIVIVPTKYFSTPTEVFERAGISLVIWANQTVRAATQAMQDVARLIHQQRNLVEAESRIASVSEIFRLQGADELEQAEKRYNLSPQPHTKAIVLAATRGKELHSLTEDRPKAMLPLAGKPLLRHLVDHCKSAGINDITVVTGYHPEAFTLGGIQTITNPSPETGGELGSLACAIDSLGEQSLILFGDLLFRPYILDDLLATEGEIVTVVDSALPPSPGNTQDLAYCDSPDDLALYQQEVHLTQISQFPLAGRQPCGRWVGMVLVRGEANQRIQQVLSQLQQEMPDANLALADLLNALLQQGERIRVSYIHGHWLDINNLDDLQRAGQLVPPATQGMDDD